MKINLSVISGSLDSLKKLGSLDLGSPGLNFKFAHVLKKIDDEVRIFMEQQIKIVHKYGKDNGDGSFSVAAENIECFQKELNEFNSLETEIEWEKADIPLTKLNGITAVEMNLFEQYFINIIEEDKS